MTMMLFRNFPLLYSFIWLVVRHDQTTFTAAFFVNRVKTAAVQYYHPIPLRQGQQQKQYFYGRTTTTTMSFLQAAAAGAADDSSSSSILQPGDPVMLVGPGFLQLVLARHLAQAGFKPIVVAPQKKLDSFFTNLIKTGPGNNDLDGINEQIRDDATIGMPEVGDPYFGELKAVVFCAEEAVLPSEFVSRVLDFTDQGKSVFANNGRPTRVICCLPVDGKIQKERSNSWIPIFNTDKTQQDNWNAFVKTFQEHPIFAEKDGVGSIIRFGSLLGGSYDGPAWLKDYGLDEGMYKVRTVDDPVVAVLSKQRGVLHYISKLARSTTHDSLSLTCFMFHAPCICIFTQYTDVLGTISRYARTCL
jgi:hypothetical protein